MRLSKEELKMLEQLSKGNNKVESVAKSLKKSKSHVYRLAKSLAVKGMIELKKGILEPKRLTHVAILLSLLSQYPSLIPPFSDSGISLFTALLTVNDLEGIMGKTGMKKAMIFRKLKQARAISLVEKKKYAINSRIWPKAEEFLSELSRYEKAADSRLPIGSEIHFRNEKEIVFSSKAGIDAAITGFSAYKEYGINVLSPMTDYCLPKRKLSKKDIFRHSLYIAENEKSARNITLVALFYIKFRKSFAKVKNNILDNIKRILKGDKIEGYPSLEEIKEKAETYGIEVK